MRFSAPLALFGLACACTSDTPPAVDMIAPADLRVVDQTPPTDFSFPPRDARAHPQPIAIQLNGGRVLKKIDVVTVLWDGDDLGPERAAFAAWAVNSEYYDTLAPYKVMRGSARGPYTIKAAFPTSLDDSQVPSLLRARVADGTLPVPTVDTLYVLYLPDGTTSTAGSLQGCREYGGYHRWGATGLTVPSLVAYAIIPTCTTGSARLDSDTIVASHEIAEAATDPDGRGWYGSAPQTEISDLCNPLTYTYDNIAVADGGVAPSYVVARNWSFAAAAAGTSDPCVPVPGAPYEWFNAGIDPTDLVLTLDNSGQGTITFQVQPFSYGATPRMITWDIRQGPAHGVWFSSLHGSGAPGSTQEVTVKATDSPFGVYPIYLEARSGGFMNVWYATLTIQ